MICLIWVNALVCVCVQIDFGVSSHLFVRCGVSPGVQRVPRQPHYIGASFSILLRRPFNTLGRSRLGGDCGCGWYNIFGPVINGMSEFRFQLMVEAECVRRGAVVCGRMALAQTRLPVCHRRRMYFIRSIAMATNTSDLNEVILRRFGTIAWLLLTIVNTLASFASYVLRTIIK